MRTSHYRRRCDHGDARSIADLAGRRIARLVVAHAVDIARRCSKSDESRHDASMSEPPTAAAIPLATDVGAAGVGSSRSQPALPQSPARPRSRSSLQRFCGPPARSFARQRLRHDFGPSSDEQRGAAPLRVQSSSPDHSATARARRSKGVTSVVGVTTAGDSGLSARSRRCAASGVWFDGMHALVHPAAMRNVPSAATAPSDHVRAGRASTSSATCRRPALNRNTIRRSAARRRCPKPPSCPALPFAVKRSVALRAGASRSTNPILHESSKNRALLAGPGGIPWCISARTTNRQYYRPARALIDRLLAASPSLAPHCARPATSLSVRAVPRPRARTGLALETLRRRPTLALGAGAGHVAPVLGAMTLSLLCPRSRADADPACPGTGSSPSGASTTAARARTPETKSRS